MIVVGAQNKPLPNTYTESQSVTLQTATIQYVTVHLL